MPPRHRGSCSHLLVHSPDSRLPVLIVTSNCRQSRNGSSTNVSSVSAVHVYMHHPAETNLPLVSNFYVQGQTPIERGDSVGA